MLQKRPVKFMKACPWDFPTLLAVVLGLLLFSSEVAIAETTATTFQLFGNVLDSPDGQFPPPANFFVNRDVELFGEDTLTFNIGTRIGDEIVYSGQARLDTDPGMDPGEDPADQGALYQIGIQTELTIGSSAVPVSYETAVGSLFDARLDTSLTAEILIRLIVESTSGQLIDSAIFPVRLSGMAEFDIILDGNAELDPTMFQTGVGVGGAFGSFLLTNTLLTNGNSFGSLPGPTEFSRLDRPDGSVRIQARYSMPFEIDSEISVVEGALVSDANILWRVNSQMFFSPEGGSGSVFGSWGFDGFETFTLDSIELPFEGFSVHVAGRPPAVPEPGTALLFATATGFLSLAMRRRRAA